jgi:hypothetical protein
VTLILNPVRIKHVKAPIMEVMILRLVWTWGLKEPSNRSIFMCPSSLSTHGAAKNVIHRMQYSVISNIHTTATLKPLRITATVTDTIK